MDALDRLYRRLVDTVLSAPDAPLTVGDLYQSLVPYRQVRAELGFSELAEYEHALLRMLAGERDYLVVERPEVQEELQRELRAPNPILGVYRDYAEVAVHLNPYASPPAADLTAPPPQPRRKEPRPEPEAAAAPEPQPARQLPRPCPACRSALPAGREARYCPFCGKCLVPVPCGECSAMVEPEWRFCASCGWERDAGRILPPPSPEQRLR